MLLFAVRAVAWIMMCRYRDGFLKSVLGPTAELLSFAPPKESSQRKGGPNAAYFLCSSLLTGVAERSFLPLRQRDASLHRPFGLILPKVPVLGAAYGINTLPNFKGRSTSFGVSMNMEVI
ncbi:hypothetical protein EDE11_112104 [Methylomonas methanica]|uniref:Uncharacterized protein n=3 Tax=Methylococcaceae TaxID=403 RepID=A0A126T4Z9_9GAMM|nr:hypothetical protein JT25_011815 [Methylomonas denitrificans]OAH97101.1 hypothetical protein A1342_20600 [Methylomonas methanica]TCV82674.1 hypothetical protein EDE11_112104 [Methylomonas methanica]